MGFPDGSAVTESACIVADKNPWVQSLGQGRYPGEGNGNPSQYSCLGNPIGRWSLVDYSPYSLKSQT